MDLILLLMQFPIKKKINSQRISIVKQYSPVIIRAIIIFPILKNYAIIRLRLNNLEVL